MPRRAGTGHPSSRANAWLAPMSVIGGTYRPPITNDNRPPPVVEDRIGPEEGRRSAEPGDVVEDLRGRLARWRRGDVDGESVGMGDVEHRPGRHERPHPVGIDPLEAVGAIRARDA